MATQNARGGWDLSAADVAEVLAVSNDGGHIRGRDDQGPKYDTAEAVDDALSAAKARWDHGDAPYDPDVLALIRAAEAMRAALYGGTSGHGLDG